MLTPSIGFCPTPSTMTGVGMPVTSRIVGTTSMTWWNWLRTPRLSEIRFGQETHMPWRAPPKKDGICLVHLNGVSKAQVEPTAMCGYVWFVPQASENFIWSAIRIWTKPLRPMANRPSPAGAAPGRRGRTPPPPRLEQAPPGGARRPKEAAAFRLQAGREATPSAAIDSQSVKTAGGGADAGNRVKGRRRRIPVDALGY
jgi:hypothetical protein